MDYCFTQILEAITQMNESKDIHLKELNMICLNTANLLIANTQVNVKKINTYVNKMMKMADTYMSDYNARPGLADHEKITRRYVDQTFEAFRRKKEAQASEASMRESLASSRASEASAYAP